MCFPPVASCATTAGKFFKRGGSVVHADPGFAVKLTEDHARTFAAMTLGHLGERAGVILRQHHGEIRVGMDHRPTPFEKLSNRRFAGANGLKTHGNPSPHVTDAEAHCVTFRGSAIDAGEERGERAIIRPC